MEESEEPNTYLYSLFDRHTGLFQWITFYELRMIFFEGLMIDNAENEYS